MDALREAITANAPMYMAIGGLIIGLIFGFIVFRTNYCAMGAISDIMNLGDYNRFRAWLLAAATALIGTQLLHYAGIVDLKLAMYTAPSFNWLGNIIGGFIFGYGMIFAGGCASKNLTRVGGGDLRSLLTLIVMGIFAYMSIGGIIGPARDWLARMTSINLADASMPTQSLGDIAAKLTGMAPGTTALVLMALISLIMLAYVFADGNFRAHPIHIVAGIGVGLCVIAGWALTGMAYDEFADSPVSPISLTYSRPTGDTLEWLQRFTAGMMPGFGVASVFGAIFGAFLAAITSGKFMITTFADTADTKRNLFGGALMGIGGIAALGCTVGQAITGFSTLAIGSMITFAAIVIGGIVGMKAFERALMADA